MTDIISEKEKTKSEEPSSISYNINKSKKFGNPPKFDNIGLGERYIESDEEEDNDNNINNVNDKDNNVNNKKNNDNDDMDIKLQYMNCIESKAKNQADDLSKKKFNNLRRTIMKNKGLKDSLDIYKNNKNNKNNPSSKEINDEIEYDLDNQIEVQKIRNERRAVISTMYQLKPENKRLKEEFNIENIEYSLEEASIDSIENIIELITNPFGNYIIQRILLLIEGESRSNLIHYIINWYPEIKALSFGPRLISKLHKRFQEFTVLVTEKYGWETTQEISYIFKNNYFVHNNNGINNMQFIGNSNMLNNFGNRMNGANNNNFMNFQNKNNVGNINFIQMNNYMLSNGQKGLII